MTAADRLSRLPWRARTFLAPLWVRGLLPAAVFGVYLTALLGTDPELDGARAEIAGATVLGAISVAVFLGCSRAAQDARLRASAPPVSRLVWQHRADVAWLGTATDDPDVRAWARWLVERDLIGPRGTGEPSRWRPFTTLAVAVLGAVALVLLLRLIDVEPSPVQPIALVTWGVWGCAHDLRLQRRRAALLPARTPGR